VSSSNDEVFALLTLTTIIDVHRHRAGSARASRWRVRIVEELCRIVAQAHLRQLAHPNLRTAEVTFAADGSLQVHGFVPIQSPHELDADLDALGVIADALVGSPPAPIRLAPEVDRIPRAWVGPPLAFFETPRFFWPAVACSVALLIGPSWSAVGLCVGLVVLRGRRVVARLEREAAKLADKSRGRDR